jgi:putative ABC transport system permease protein
MSLWKIALRSIQQRSLASGLTGLSMALGVTLVVAVLVMRGAINSSFLSTRGLGYNLIVGAKGSKVQLVLNTVYYLSSPVENLPYSFYKEFTQGKYKAYTAQAVPVCLGDVYGDFRVVGTTPAMFNDLDYGNGQKYTFSSGRNFTHDGFFEAVIGSRVARDTGLKVGDEFHPQHGEGGHKHDPFRIVGIIQQTNTPVDRALFVNIEGFYLLENHARPVEPLVPEAEHAEHEHAEHKHAEHEHAEHEHGHDEHGHDEHGHSHRPLPESQREVTAILLLTSSVPGAPPELAAMGLIKAINKGPIGQAVLPIGEISALFSLLIGPLETLLLVLTVMIVVVSGIGILVSIYNSMNDRRREIAIMRALGAGRSTVMWVVLFESILLSLGGGLVGWILGHMLVGGLSPWISLQTGVQIGMLKFDAQELVIIPGLILLASLVGYLPALVAYRTDVSRALSAAP